MGVLDFALLWVGLSECESFLVGEEERFRLRDGDFERFLRGGEGEGEEEEEEEEEGGLGEQLLASIFLGEF